MGGNERGQDLARGEKIALVDHLGHRVDVARADGDADRPRPRGRLLDGGADGLSWKKGKRRRDPPRRLPIPVQG